MKCPIIFVIAFQCFVFGSVHIVHVMGACLRNGNKQHVLQGKNWTTRDNQLLYGNEIFRLKGVNWNGFESDCRVVHGLWTHPLEHYVEVLRKQDFNALRIPLSYEIMDNLNLPIKAACATADPSIYPDMTVRTYLSIFLDKMRANNLFVLFDLHTIDAQITEFPWTDQVTEAQVLAAWANFAKAFGQHPAIMGLEIKNEPHGMCTTTEFHRHSANVIDHIGDDFNGLYFIDGTALSSVDGLKAPWGGTFEEMSPECHDDDLCQLGIFQKIVFAPHVYGPDVRGDDALAENDDTFERRYGFLRKHAFFHGSAIVVTEFGGRMSDVHGPDYQYFERWKRYMEHANLTAGAFFWTFPPSSFDTGGFLYDDWQTLDQRKLDFLKTVQPQPSQIFIC